MEINSLSWSTCTYWLIFSNSHVFCYISPDTHSKLGILPLLPIACSPGHLAGSHPGHHAFLTDLLDFLPFIQQPSTSANLPIIPIPCAISFNRGAYDAYANKSTTGGSCEIISVFPSITTCLWTVLYTFHSLGIELMKQRTSKKDLKRVHLFYLALLCTFYR